jgi:hypothetical protein
MTNGWKSFKNNYIDDPSKEKEEELKFPGQI